MNKYNALASIYDKFTNEFWQDYIEIILPYIPSENDEPVNILDLACGTGTALDHLPYLNFKYVGVDHSCEMIKIAKQKFPFADFVEGDISSFMSSTCEFDLIMCCFDSINHLINVGQWESLIENAKVMLSAGGTFIFDFTTVYDHMNNWPYYMDVQEVPNDYYLVRYGDYDKKRNIAKMNFDFFIMDSEKRFEKYHDEIEQISIDIDDLEMILKENFSNVRFLDLNENEPLSERTPHAIAICQF